MQLPLEALGGRRFLLAVLACVVSSTLLAFGKLSDGGYVTIMLASVCAFIGAGTFQRHSEIRADVQKTIASAQVEAAPSDAVEQVPK